MIMIWFKVNTNYQSPFQTTQIINSNKQTGKHAQFSRNEMDSINFTKQHFIKTVSKKKIATKTGPR